MQDFVYFFLRHQDEKVQAFGKALYNAIDTAIDSTPKAIASNSGPVLNHTFTVTHKVSVDTNTPGDGTVTTSKIGDDQVRSPLVCTNLT